MYNQGQLVRNTVDGSRPGYGGKDLITFKELVKLDLPYSEATLSNVFSSPDRNKNLKKLFKDNGFEVVSKGPRNTLLFNRPSAGQIDNLWQDTIKLVESGKATIPDKMRTPFKNEVLKVFNELKKTNTPFTTSDIYYKVVENVGDNKRVFIPKKLKGDTRVPGESIKVALGKENSEFLLDGNIARIEKTTVNRKKMFDLLLKGKTDVTSLAKDLGISKKDVYAEANKLFDDSYRYNANLVRKTGAGSGYGYLKDYNQSDFNTVLKNLRKSGFEKLDERSARALIYDAYKDSPKKFDAALKKLSEYNKINTELRNTFGKGFQLDHTLSFKALKDLGNTTAENLIRFNPLPENINKMKVAFDRSYNNIITQLRDGNISPNISKNLLEKKKLIEDISTKTNIGSFKVDASGKKILSFGSQPFLKTDIPSQMLKNVDVQNRLVDVLKDYSDEDLKKITKKKSFESLRNLEKIPKKEINLIKKDLLKLAGTANKKCKGLLSYGGRAGLAEGLSPEFCINEGKKVARDLASKKIEGTLAQKSMMGKLMTSAKNLVKGILNPEELFDIKKQLFSKAALASFPIFDVLDALDDVGRKGISFKEAFANTLTFGTLPQSLGLTKNMDVLNAEKMLNDPDLSPAGKEYAQYLIDVDRYKKLKSTPSASHPNVKEKIKKLEEKIINTKMTGESDYLSALSNTLDQETSGRYVGEANKIMPGYEVAFDGKDIRKVNEYGYATKGASYDAADKTKAPSFFSGELKKSYGDLKQESGKLPEYDINMIPAYVSQNYKTMEENPLTKENIDYITNLERESGLLRPGENLDSFNLAVDRFQKNNQGVSTKQEVKGPTPLEHYQNRNKWFQALSQPGIKGSQDKFADGGLANLMKKYYD
jgi:hypothetical protein